MLRHPSKAVFTHVKRERDVKDPNKRLLHTAIYLYICYWDINEWRFRNSRPETGNVKTEHDLGWGGT